MAVLIPEGLRNLKGVSSGLKKTARGLQVGLDDDATVWYEPPYDPAGEKPDLVVLVPDRGIAVIEVLKTVKKARFLGLFGGQVRLEQDGREVNQDNPLVRARKMADSLTKRLQEHSSLASLQLPVRSLAAFPDQARASVPEGTASLELQHCLFQEELQEAIDGLGPAALLRVFARALGPTLGALGARDQDLLRAVIQPSLALKRPPSSPKQLELPLPESKEDIIKVMDRKQEILAKSLGEGHRVLRGVAGSGKTVILVYRARLMAQAYPRRRFLLTCYTRSLRSFMAAQLADHPNVEVVHLDALMSRVIKDAQGKHPGYRDDDANEAVAREALTALARLGARRPVYQGVFVDEGQDFGPDCLQFITRLLENPEESDLLIVMDAAQNIFRRTFSFRKAGVKAQGRTRILRVNYRNTQEILSFAHSFLTAGRDDEDDVDEENENQIISPEAAYRHGPYPFVVKVASASELVSRVAEQAASWVKENRSPGGVGILYPSHSRGQELRDKLTSKGLSVFWGGDKAARDSLASAAEPVVLLTYHSAKGLEFPRVILAGLDFDVPGDQRMIAYVGMTRAMNELLVVTPASALAGELPQGLPARPVWQVTNVQGRTLEIRVPIPLDPLETAALGALARHGQLDEATLARELGTRRIGGLMERLMEKLARAQSPLIKPGREASEGRTYVFADPTRA